MGNLVNDAKYCTKYMQSIVNVYNETESSKKVLKKTGHFFFKTKIVKVVNARSS